MPIDKEPNAGDSPASKSLSFNEEGRETSVDDNRTTSLVQDVPKSSWKSYLWDTLDKSPEERRFLFKLDAFVLTFASLGYSIKYLDQININNAFVCISLSTLHVVKVPTYYRSPG
jgi:MFS transporter, ACS family, pantothenate transporter